MAWSPVRDGWLPILTTAPAGGYGAGAPASGLLISAWEPASLIAPGDSGGPALLGHQLAGGDCQLFVARHYMPSRISTVLATAVTVIAAWQRISYYQQWIDQTVRAADTAAPSKASQVQKTVAEGAAGTLTRAYFLLEFTGTRSKKRPGPECRLRDP